MTRKLLFLLTILGSLASASAMANQVATFAGGCFWCMQGEFAAMKGVSKVTSGYTGGRTPNPTYALVSQGGTGHFEAIEINYNPKKVSYQQLLDVFWKNIDPLDEFGQFCDKGSQYRAGIFTHSAAQYKLADESREKVKAMFPAHVATVIETAGKFYPAEDYHQDYYIKNKTRYKLYREGCGRDDRLEKLWKDKPPSVTAAPAS